MNEDCLKLTTYFGERDRTEHHLLADELLDLYGRHQVQTSIPMRGIEGFGRGHQVHTDRLLTLSEDLPVVSVAVDTRPRIEGLLQDVLAVKRRGLLTLERARMLSGEVPPLELPQELHEATKLTVYVGRKERVQRTPAFVAVCELLHRHELSGATVLLGVDGTSHGERARAQFFARNAEVPTMIIAVGPGEQIARVLPELGATLQTPLLTLERIRVCKRDGQLLATPHALPGTDEHGLALWQKLMIYSSEYARHDGHPLHRALVRRLRQSSAAGATSLRGIWAFTATMHHMATSSCSSAATSPWSRSSSTHLTASPKPLRSSTRSRAKAVWSPARWSPQWQPSPRTSGKGVFVSLDTPSKA